MSETIYKLLNPDRSPCHGGSGIWPEPGIWTEPHKPVPCESGYHGLRVSDLSRWIKIDTVLWTMEGRGESVVCDDKVVHAEARLIEKVGMLGERRLRLFAADCAEHVLRLFEEKYPTDSRPRRAIKAARSRNAAYASSAAYASYAYAAAYAERLWQGERLLAYLTDESCD